MDVNPGSFESGNYWL